jgi:RsiW-degrading membrane proteinase PrsW (M82 family)
MADFTSTVSGIATSVVGLVKALIVMFVFVNIIYSTGFDPIGGIVDLVESFLDGGFSGLLALLIFVSFAYRFKILKRKVRTLQRCSAR